MKLVRQYFPLLPILLAAAALRFYGASWHDDPNGSLLNALPFHGVDWDNGQHLHPDERFIAIVSTRSLFPPRLDRTSILLVAAESVQQRLRRLRLRHPAAVLRTLAGRGHRLRRLRPRSSTWDERFQPWRTSAPSPSSICLVDASTAGGWPSSPRLIGAFAVTDIQLSHFYAFDTFVDFLCSLVALLRLPRVADRKLAQSTHARSWNWLRGGLEDQRTNARPIALLACVIPWGRRPGRALA